MMRKPASLAIGLALAVLGGCQREERETRPEPVLGESQQAVPVTALEPGGNRPQFSNPKAAQFEGNAYHISQGKTLFSAFNCNGCHSNGGGGMGPALMDEKWLYGNSIESIHASIRDGRPNGMPTFGRLIPDDQLWELAAYVKSMGGNVPSAAAPGRNDDMMARPAENRMPNAATQGRTP
ncbi:c-type cytochrome [Pseudaminobacter soli (ex Zhang et al. 2022)]